MRTTQGEEVCVAFVSVGDVWETALGLHYGPAELNDIRRGILRFAVLPVDGRVAEEWARIVLEADRMGID